MAVTSAVNQSSGSATRNFRSEWVRQRARDIGYKRLEDLAIAAGITRQQLHRLLAQESLPSNETAHGLAKALRCMTDDLTEEIAAEMQQ